MKDFFDIPILMLVFNRPVETKRVFEVIKAIKPAKLYVAADGPRTNKPDDLLLTEETRNVFKQIDWPCEVKFLFREENLGCGPSVSNAITWFFNQEEMGIILEDDCLPNHSFFHFCETLLEKYKDDPRIMHIGGSNFQQGMQRGEASYYFSMNNHVWGWASWRRAWNLYDYEMKTIRHVSDLNLDFYTKNSGLKKFWRLLLLFMRRKEINTWDYQWAFSIFKNKGLSIVPNTNMITNIGNTQGSTHSSAKDPSWTMNLPAYSLKDIIHPSVISINTAADDFYFEKAQKNTDSVLKKVIKKFRIPHLFIQKK